MRVAFTLASCLLAFLIPLTTHSAQVKLRDQQFTVPDGFEVELVATPPLADRPIYGAFDEQGRLYVVDSSGMNDKPDKQLETRPHRVMRLEDVDGDGRFDRSTVFADKMMFPEGCMWFDGSVYVAAPPSIWKLTDTNNDGVADIRVEWHEGKTLTGCANDLHGPFLGLDGWIYWCKGASAEQRYERPGKPPLVTRAAHIFRSPPDHSDIEQVLAGGMDNPVAVAFTAGGERILCGTFFITHEPGKRDGLIHAIYGGVYGKINSSTDDHKKTGDLMPIMTHMGPAAPCSVIRYESPAFGEEYRDNLFLCTFNLHKVSRHILEPDGATFKTKDSDFLTSDNPDFHPTDVIEDADGSLLVIDTGGWYKICCPTAQLSKPDVLGAVYRIRRVGAPKVQDPRGLKIAWTNSNATDLARLLGDPRPAVARRALYELSKQPATAVAPVAKCLNKDHPVQTRRNAVWALTRMAAPAAREAVRSALGDEDESVRMAALHSVSLWRDAGAAQSVRGLLKMPNPSVQRVAAEALGRIGDRESVQKLLAVASEKHDRVLEHSLTYALIEIADPQPVVTALKTACEHSQQSSVPLQQTALIALDQMTGGKLQPELVAPYLSSSDPLLRQTASWVVGHHPEWGGALAGVFRERLQQTKLSNEDRAQLEQQLAQLADNEAIQDLLGSSLAEPTTPLTRKIVLRAVSRASLKKVQPGCAEGVRSCLAEKDESVLEEAVKTARTLSQVKTNAPSFAEALKRIARNEAHPASLRLEALAALPNGLRSVEPELLAFLFANVEPSKPVTDRSAAAAVLAKAKLNDEQLLRLADTLKTTGPLELPKLLGPFEHSTNEAVGLKLISAVKESKGVSSLRADLIKNVTAKYPPAVQQQANELLALLNVDLAKQGAHLDQLLGVLKEGDIRRGQAVFNSQKAACASCHRMGYMGGDVGPDLTSIGTVRTERDLLESIVYPNVTFVRSYEPIIVHTRADEDLSGVLKKEAPDEIVLATGPNAQARIARADISEMRPGTVSVMPGGLDEQLTKQELADLLAFLKATKWGPR